MSCCLDLRRPERKLLCAVQLCAHTRIRADMHAGVRRDIPTYVLDQFTQIADEFLRSCSESETKEVQTLTEITIYA